jgi:hypothetical protein
MIALYIHHLENRREKENSSAGWNKKTTNDVAPA